jgi:hypothetical protein
MTSDLPRKSIRLDRKVIRKIEVISDIEDRTFNGQITYVLKQFIADYETKNGEIKD